jgi:hypothetical protein
VPGTSTRGRGFLKKQNSSPSVALGEEVSKKGISSSSVALGEEVKKEMAPTALNCPREVAWHSGKASPSARDLALGEGGFAVRSIPGRPSPSVALREAFPEYFGAFPECISHSGKAASPVVNTYTVIYLTIFFLTNVSGHI